MGIVAGGKTQISANTGSIANGDNIVSYLVDSVGALLTSTTVNTNPYLNVFAAGTFGEDTGHVSGDLGHQMLAVRNDSGVALAGTDLDYIPLSTDSTGKLLVNAQFPVTQNFTVAEDSAVSNGQILAMMGVVRNDTAGTQVSANGDAAWIQQNAVGEIRVVNKSETAILQQVIVVGTTAVALPTVALANRKSIMVQMLSNGNLYIGSTTVTSTGATRGIQLGRGGFVNLDVGPTPVIYGIADAAGKDVAILEMS
jgi:hypothetical protein